MVSNAVCAIFALTHAALAQRRPLTVSLGGAFLVWFCGAGLTQLVDWNVAGAVLLNVLVFPLAIYAGRHLRAEGAIKRVQLSGIDLAWRATIVTLCVIVVTAASSSIGSFASGLFAFFPVAMGSFFVILQPRIGGPAAASVAAHVQAPLVGLGLSLLAGAFFGGADWRVVVLRDWIVDWARLERTVMGCAQLAATKLIQQPCFERLDLERQIARKNPALR